MVYICDDDYSNIRITDDILGWARWLDKWPKRLVANNQIGGHFVSTIFIGVDSSVEHDGAPRVFETMIFAEGLPCDMYRIRTPSVEDALYAHEAAVAEVLDNVEEKQK